MHASEYTTTCTIAVALEWYTDDIAMHLAINWAGLVFRQPLAYVPL